MNTTSDTDMGNVDQTEDAEKTILAKVIDGDYGLARTYWTLFLTGMLAFFIYGSIQVADRTWVPFLIALGFTVLWSALLIAGIWRAYKGPEHWKVVARTSILFFILNLSNTIATLIFI